MARVMCRSAASECDREKSWFTSRRCGPRPGSSRLLMLRLRPPWASGTYSMMPQHVTSADTALGDPVSGDSITPDHVGLDDPRASLGASRQLYVNSRSGSSSAARRP